ncbi:alcohol dehydrogenase catalytic domain-containing protein [Streptomyces sp. ADI95-17]|uniref:alcohol dehydrogenase catalytic domain-containing protein n=2 Tax=Streptomyces TaxID=1883 RepID=UPI002405FE48|nr:alcohol dehydrogenase catalytic domain-containing protein [Streptomyces sp. ADI95-17]WSX05713.1 alcohol dehydrogenase catalytic domain-containing protein [Streptomyces sp. NBC_00987]
MVRARATALNNADASMLAGADPTAGGTGHEYRAGYEFAGEVTAVGEGVDTPAVGERVTGTTQPARDTTLDHGAPCGFRAVPGRGRCHPPSVVLSHSHARPAADRAAIARCVSLTNNLSSLGD